jgi:hypothetical protein
VENNRCTALRATLAALVALVLLSGLPAVRAQGIFSADSRIAVTTLVVSSVVAPIVITTSPSTLYAIEGATTSTVSPTWVKMYNGTPAACGASAGTPFARYLIPVSPGLLQQEVANGDGYGAGITACIVGGIADSDTSSPPANAATINWHWKRQQ